jgi:RNA polymerase sigma-70 factor, ECF subfamily
MDPNNECEIARGLQCGQIEAWHALYDAYARQIWRAVARLMGPAASETADVVQETFLAAARSARAYDEAQGSLWQWLYGIARNQTALHYRRRQRQDRVARDADWLGRGNQHVVRWLENREPTPGDSLATAELKTLVKSVMLEIPSDYESLLTAKYIDGNSVEQIAVAENRTVSAVRSKLARARRAFRETFMRNIPEYFE